MPTAEYMRDIVDQYVTAINAGDMQAVIALYADDAEVEDPAGTVPKRGDAILEFYTNAFSGGAKVALSGPVRLSAKAAAFPFRAEISGPNGTVTHVEVIDIFDFDEAGKVEKMTAHFGSTNIKVTSS